MYLGFQPNDAGLSFESDPSESELEDMSPEEKVKVADRKSKICLYEILSVMVLMSYAEEHNKVRMLFNLFDFENNQGLEQEEFVVMTIIILEGWGRFS